MKKILLWDPRFPARAPVRLNIHDDIASAALRAGVATAADPTELGALSSGSAVSAANLVEILLQTGVSQRMVRVVLPLAVAQVAVSLGLGAVPIGSTTVVAVPLNLLLSEGGVPLLSEDGSYLLSE